MTFTDLGDGSVLAGGVIPAQGVYEVDYLTSLSGITGVRLEALEYAGLPGPGGLGPGFFFNGAFVLTEIELFTSSIPEPETYAMLIAGLGLRGWHARRRKNKQVS